MSTEPQLCYRFSNTGMKVTTWILIFWSLLVLTSAIMSTIHAPLGIITLKDITPYERRQIAYWEQKQARAKRSGGDSSGSGVILNILKTSIGNGIKKKIGQVSKASAAASGAFSSSSSRKEHEYYHHTDHYPQEHHESSSDLWYFKKSVLNTLLQAVKAIKGGVIALKGQLIKGGGKLVSASGKIVSAKGDAITTLGKTIAKNAILVPYDASSSKHPSEIEVESHPHYSEEPEEIYHNGPSASHLDYHVSENYPSVRGQDAAGLLILKKMTDLNPHQFHHDHTSSASNMVGKLFSASSSLDPHKPELFVENVRSFGNTDGYEPYVAPSFKEENKVVFSGPHGSQEIGESTISKSQISSIASGFKDQSSNYINQNHLNNLHASPSTNPIRIFRQTPEINPQLTNSNEYDMEYAQANIPDGNVGLTSSNTNVYSNIIKPLSQYLESPKLNYLQPNTKSSSTSYRLSDLSEYNLDQPHSFIR